VLYDFTPQTITIYNKYVRRGSVRYKRTILNRCKITTKDAVRLGQVEVQGSNSGKVFVYEKDLNMERYVEPSKFIGRGFTFANETLVVIGEGEKIESVSELTNPYTVIGVYHNNTSFVLDHHFILEIV